MARPMRIVAACDDSGLTTVRVLIRHDMETGFRKRKDGTLVPAHFIKNVMVRHGEKTVLSAEWGGGVAGGGEVAGAVVGDPVEDREEGELIWVWVWGWGNGGVPKRGEDGFIDLGRKNGYGS